MHTKKLTQLQTDVVKDIDENKLSRPIHALFVQFFKMCELNICFFTSLALHELMKKKIEPYDTTKPM